jgi:predicted TIM-barrel fold metal-dependent hydrolase
VPRAIDVHVHPSTREFVDDAMGEYTPACEAHFRTTLPRHDVEEMARVFRDADILGVLFAWDAETNTGLPPVANDFVSQCAREHPDAFVGYASVDPLKGEAAIVELERAVRMLGLRGLKLHPSAQGFRPDDRAVYPVWETAQSLGVPVTVHTGTTGLGAGMDGGGRMKLELSRPIHLDAVAADFPRLQIVMAHPAWPWQDEQLAVAQHKANTWIDLSGWSPRRFAPRARAQHLRPTPGPRALRDRLPLHPPRPVARRLGHARRARRRHREGAAAQRPAPPRPPLTPQTPLTPPCPVG